jgi:hypothetical protein
MLVTPGNSTTAPHACFSRTVCTSRRRVFEPKAGVRRAADEAALPSWQIASIKASNSECSGEKFGAAVEAWGINIYRGRTFTNLFRQLKNTTTKPTMLTEYGASAAYHPAWSNSRITVPANLGSEEQRE